MNLSGVDNHSGSELAMLKAILPKVDEAMVDRWNKEWMLYFSTEDMTQHIIQSNKLKFIDMLHGKDEAALHSTVMANLPSGKPVAPLRIWVKGEEIIGKKIVEIGCGCGLLGKQVASVASHYLGLDYAQLALAIARGNSPDNCTYLHLSEESEISTYSETCDILVSREFFIHQNFQNALWVLRLGKFLLKSGGIIVADFYEGDPNVPQGIIHSARSPLDPKYASCAFNFTLEDINDLAREAGLLIVNVHDYRPHQRRFVRFCKP